MATEQTRTSLLDAAERLFGEHGYGGTSVRSITSDAGTDLGAVRYHFGSKQALIEAVLRRRLEPLSEARVRLLEAAEARRHPDPPALEEIVECFFRPALDFVQDPELGEIWIKLIARARVEPLQFSPGQRGRFTEVWRRFHDALARALPDLPDPDLTYRFFFLFGAEVNTITDRFTLKILNEDLPDLLEAPEQVMSRLVEFVCAGMRAPLPHRTPDGDQR